MSAQKKCAKNIAKNKFISEEKKHFVEDSEYSNYFNKEPQRTLLNKKPQKRQRVKAAGEEEDIKSIEQYPTCNKKNKETDIESQGLKQNVLKTMKTQTNSRKESTDHVLKSLTEVIMHLDLDCNIMKSNEQKIESIIGTIMKCIQQSTAAYTQSLEKLKGFHGYFKKQCEDMEADHDTQTSKLANVLDEDIKKLQEKLIRQAKLKHMELLHKSIKTMQNGL